ncbi:MAG: VCBS repeat-containing protein [Taibaiella sp.]|nr:VCBS repeat-containing protein [Taibaiella sp.]
MVFSYKYTWLFVICLAVATSSYSQTYVAVPGDTSGYTPGSFTVNDAGAANYSIPLVLVPGTNGVQPPLSLVYNSQGGNGICGLGWSLSGLSAISRTAQTYAQDGQSLAITFTNTDRFALDGERLVLNDLSGPYGGSGSEYRTEQNSFSQVKAFGSLPSSPGTPLYFVVRTNSGNVMEFGTTADSRIGIRGGYVLNWLLSKVSDTKGNYYTFTYFKDSLTGEYYPTRIDYTGNSAAALMPYASVEFSYENRADSISRYLNGVAISANKKRLVSVKNYFGSTLVRAYYLTYQNSPSKISELVSVRECGTGGCHTPTTFSWANIDAPSFSTEDFNYISKTTSTDKIVSIDVDADGVQDILKVPQFGSGTVQAYVSNKNAGALGFINKPVVPFINVTQKFLTADFNADGKPDILLYDSTTSGDSKAYLNTDSIGATQVTFNYVVSPLPPIMVTGNKIVNAIDVNGDGRSDLLSFDPVSGFNYWMFSTTAGTAGMSFIPNGSLNYFANLITDVAMFQGAYQPFFADFTGDGKVDVLFWNPASGATKLYKNTQGFTPVTFILDTANFIPASQISTSGGSMRIADFNSDGLPDVLYYVKATGANYWWVNKGNRQFIAATASPTTLSSSISGGTDLLLQDFNCDGYADLVWFDKVTGQNKWFTNDGKLNFTQLPGTIVSASLLAGYDLTGLGNFSSKSNLDLFLFNNSATPKARILKGAKQFNSLMTRIESGNGQVVDVNYDLLTSDSVYFKYNDARYPLMDYQGTQFVVKDWQTDDGVGTKDSKWYKYFGGKINLAGRGFRGFSKVEVLDGKTSIVVSRTFLNDSNSWKYLNSPLLQTTTKLPTGVIISQTDITSGLTTFYDGKCYFSYVNRNRSKTYEVDGTFIDSTITTYNYDSYGNVISTVTDYGSGSKDSLVNVFDNSYTSNWLISRLLNAHLYRTVPGHPTIVKASGFTYDLAGGTGLMTSEVIEPDSSSTVKVIKQYAYDGYGNITRTSVTAWNGTTAETRTTNTTYDLRGRFPLTFANAKGQLSSKTVDSLLGKTLTETDLNGHVKRFYYDGFGRLTKTVLPDGNWESIDYRKAGSSFPATPSLAIHLLYRQSSYAPPVIQYYDLFNRELRSQKRGFAGQTVFTDIVYDDRGQVDHQSLPYFDTATPVYTQYYYDIVNRKVKVVEPGSRIDSILYRGRTTIYKNAKGQRKTIVKDAKGNMTSVKDEQGNILAYDYDAAGRMLKTTDPAGNNIVMTYDIHGNKVKMQDPDLGIYSYVINGFGETVKQTDAAGHVMTMKYDSLGRMKMRTEPEGITTWTYDGQPNGIGLPGTVSGYGGYSAVYAYDTLSRIINETQTIDSATYSQGYSYDTLGRLKETIYPSGFKTRNFYNANGYLDQVKNASTGTVYWTASAMNAKGGITRQLYGNGTEVNKVYDTNTDLLVGVDTRLGAAYLQNMAFDYDALGNLTKRRDILLSAEEQFTYDNLNRVTKTRVTGMDSVVLTYNAIGNIMSKSDVGTYHYGPVNAGPHQVLSVDMVSGQCIPSLLINTSYNSFSKVKQISKDSTVVDIFYNPNRQRCLQKMYVSGVLARKKVYVSDIFEKEVKGGDTIITNYINTPEGKIATYVTHSTGAIAPAVHYFHRDHLGSTVLITDDTAGVVGKFSFDAWGKRRNANWSSLLTDTSSLAGERGFTGHEHYDLFDIIDMNGRVYDPVLGRFLSADPVIQDMTNLQCLNRYSYCANNPLSFTDPSGYFSLSKLFKAVTNTISSIVKYAEQNWKSIVANVVLNYFLPGSGVLNNFASSVTATLISGGNLGDALKAGVKNTIISAFNAVATFEVAEYFPSADLANSHATDIGNVGYKMIGHGVVQGVSSIANGGKFLNGFAAGAAATISEYQIGGRVSAMVAGGTASALTGGSFANGASSGAFIHMYNAEGLVSVVPKMIKGAFESSLADWGLMRTYFPLGDYLLSDNQFNDLVHLAHLTQVCVSPGEFQYNFRNTYYENFIGTGSFIINAQGIPVGFHDTYNFDQNDLKDRNSKEKAFNEIGRKLQGPFPYEIKY